MKRILWEKLKSYKIVIVAHESSIGPPQELREFLLQKQLNNLFYIAHPLIYLKEHYKDSSRYMWYKNGMPGKKHVAIHWKFPEAFLYVKDVLYTVLWCLQSNSSFDIFFGADPLNTFSGIILKKLGKVDRVIYYSIDYTPKRFESHLINHIYHFIDRYCCYRADINWVGTHRTIEARIENGVLEKRMAKTIIVPDGSHSQEVKKKNTPQIDMNTLVYVGYILEKQGIDLVIESLTEIKKKIPSVKFIVIGKGPYLPVLKKRVAHLGLGGVVEFKGFIKDDKKMQEMLAKCGVGVAPYLEDKNSFTYYSTAGKPVLYLACGLPVIITNVPSIAREIHKRKAGIAISYKKDQFINAVFTILSSKQKYNGYKNNAISFGEELDWSEIFEKGLYKTIRALHSL